MQVGVLASHVVTNLTMAKCVGGVRCHYQSLGIEVRGSYLNFSDTILVGVSGHVIIASQI